jgi:hypothetical protein
MKQLIRSIRAWICREGVRDDTLRANQYNGPGAGFGAWRALVKR